MSNEKGGIDSGDAEDDVEMKYSHLPDLEGKPNEEATFDAVINIIVPNSKKKYFREWLIDTHEAISSFSGFIARHVHSIASNDQYTEYVLVLVFNSLEHFQAWQDSSERRNRVNALHKKKIKSVVMNTYGGNCESLDGMGRVVSSDFASQLECKPARISLQNSAIEIPKPLPPPKWKLTIILIVCVYIMVVVTILSKQGVVLAKQGLPVGLITFIGVGQIVLVLVYTLLPLVMGIPVIAKWLRQTRPPVSSMHPLVRTLDQGFAMFALKMEPKVPSEILRRIDKLESNIERLRASNHKLFTELGQYKNHHYGDTAQILLQSPSSQHQEDLEKGSHTEEEEEKLSLVDNKYDNSSENNYPPQDHYAKDGAEENEEDVNYVEKALLHHPGTASQGPTERAITMAVKHYVKWECVPEFELWTDKIAAEMKR